MINRFTKLINMPTVETNLNIALMLNIYGLATTQERVSTSATTNIAAPCMQ